MLAQDLRYAVRSLRRTPGFAIVALTTIAIGIGGTTAIFSVVDGVLLRPLPYPRPETIVAVQRVAPTGDSDALSAADFLDYQQQARSFSVIAGYREDVVDLTGRGDPQRLVSLQTTAGFFDVLGTPALAGRTYTGATDRPGGPRVAVLAEHTWRERFGADPGVVGSSVRLSGTPTTIVGVMPAWVAHPSKADVWILAPGRVPTSPLAIDGDLETNRDVQYFQALGRLAPGRTLAQAREELSRLAAEIERANPDTNSNESATATPLQDTLVGEVRPALLVLLGAVGFVLLIACANVASLLLARGSVRRRELAVRTALGAGRGRLIRQLLTESLVLCAAGGALGVVLAYWGIAGLLALAPERLPRLEEVALDPRVAVFAVLVSLLTGLVCGLAPALQGSRAEVAEALKDGGRTGTGRTGVRSLLVVGEVALALVLLIGAGLMLTSFLRLQAVDPGYRIEELVVIGVPLPQARYDGPAQSRFYQALAERLGHDPVTSRSAIVFPTPFMGAQASGGIVTDADPRREPGRRPVAEFNAVTPGYFRAMGIPVLRGRDLRDDDDETRRNVVVSRALADAHWPGQDPLGHQIAVGGEFSEESARFTVVGVVGDARRADLQREPGPAVYMSYKQFPLPFMGVVVRTAAGPAAVARSVRAAVKSLDPDLPIEEARLAADLRERSTGQPRFRAVLVLAFAATALLLAAVGLYGLISYTVTQRTPEIGVRLALGANPGLVARQVVTDGLKLAGAGVALGLGGAAVLTRWVQGLLFGTSPTDPLVYGGLAALLLTIAALACYVPARRAMRVDPMIALRAE